MMDEPDTPDEAPSETPEDQSASDEASTPPPKKRKKHSAAKAIEKEPSSEELLSTAITGQDGDDLKREKRMKQFKIGGALLVLGTIGYGVHWLFAPFVGGMGFGICKVFAELNVKYPGELEYTGAQSFGKSMRIWYTQLDEFGQHRMEFMQCFYEMDQQTGMLRLEKVTINRRDVDQAIVDRFNPSIPTIYAFPPDLTYPVPDTSLLKNIKTGQDQD